MYVGFSKPLMKALSLNLLSLEWALRILARSSRAARKNNQHLPILPGGDVHFRM